MKLYLSVFLPAQNGCQLCRAVVVSQALFEIDLAQLEKVAVQLDKGDEQRRDFKGIYAECATILRQVGAVQMLWPDTCNRGTPISPNAV